MMSIYSRSFKEITQQINDAQIIIVCGPTASGKTDFAHNLALNYGAAIVNADSMQLYDGLKVLSCSPDSSLTSELPYHLYNFLPLDNICSIAYYNQIASQLIPSLLPQYKRLILVGGSGLYINSLLKGYNEMPQVSDLVREQTRERQKNLGQENFYNELKKIDPLATVKIKQNDKQRTMRAYEVYMQTGKPINSFYTQETNGILQKFKYKIIALMPEREFLYENCNKRLAWMFDDAIMEVEAFKNANIRIVVKPIGLEQILAYLAGDLTKDTALTIAQNKTRQYAKRQVTWFSHQLPKNNLFILQ